MITERMAPGTDAASRASWIPGVLLVLAGAALCGRLAGSAPEATGAALITSPAVALGIFDTLWLLLLARPGAGLAADRLALSMLGLVFHVTLAACAGASVGYHGAFGLLLGGYTALGAISVGATARLRAGLLATACFALPLSGYACIEFAGVDAWMLVHAAPTTAPAWLAGRADTASGADGVPGLAVGLAILVIEVLVGWGRRRGLAKGSADAAAAAAERASSLAAERQMPRFPRR